MKPLRPQASQDRNPNRVPLSPLTLGPLVQKGSPLRTQREAGDSQGFQLFWGAYGKQVGAGSMTDTSRPFVAGGVTQAQEGRDPTEPVCGHLAKPGALCQLDSVPTVSMELFCS